MFLNKLESTEKQAFLELAYYIANCDNNFKDSEQAMIGLYCNEMGISNIDFDLSKFNLAENLSSFKSLQSQKIVLIEAMGIIYSDNILDNNEQVVIDEIIKFFNLSSNYTTIYAEWTKAVMALTAQGEALIKL